MRVSPWNRVFALTLEFVSAVNTQIKEAFNGVSVSNDWASFLKRIVATPVKQALDNKIQRFINGEDYECGETLLDVYMNNLIDRLRPAALNAFADVSGEGVGDWPILVALFYKTFAGSDNFYPGKQQGKEFKKWMNISQKFWDVPLQNITVLPFTGKVLANDALLLPVVSWLYEIDTEVAQRIIDAVQETLVKLPAVGYNSPLWSLNSIAIGPDPEYPPEFVSIPALLMGDGFAMAFEAMRVAEAGVDYIFLHELGHFVQFSLNITELYDEGTPESTRYIELMADSLSAYMAHHPRFASFQTQRILKVSQAAYSAGDCSFEEVGHHGTPNQRRNAVLFANQLVDKSKGKVLKAADFKAKFDAAYPTIVAKDKVA
jgi:hypothetical protein